MSENALGKAVSSSDADAESTFACQDCGKEYESAPGVSYHYKNTECDSDHPCPTCGAAHFHTRKGMKLHHKKQHGESLAGTVVECDWCGDEKRVSLYDSRTHEHFFCNAGGCKAEWIRENVGGDNHPLANRVTRECDACGAEITRNPSSFAEMAFCDYECQGDWLSENQSGEDHPNWQGGRSQIVYGSGWKRARAKALERDDHSCVICGVTKEEKPKRIDVHHIRPVESFEDNSEAHDLDNLVTLCRSHHRRWEGVPLRPDTMRTQT